MEKRECDFFLFPRTALFVVYAYNKYIGEEINESSIILLSNIILRKKESQVLPHVVRLGSLRE